MKNSLTKHLLFLLVACGIALVLSGSLLAGPQPTGKEMIAPAPAPECTWTGFYLGVNGGVYWARTVIEGDGFEETPTTSMIAEDTGVIGGGQFGYDWQFNRFVIGIEGAAGGLDFDQSEEQFGGNDNFIHSKYDWYASITGRIGYAWNKLLFYGKGGVGAVDVLDESADLDGHSFDRETYSSHHDAEFTWIAGGGIEWMFACGWSLRGEYLFYGIDSTHTTNRDPDNHNFHQDHELQAFTVGLNYRFGAGH